MFENFVGLAYTWYVLGYFFDSNTSTWGKMGVRTVVQPLVNILVIEIAWRGGSYLDRSLGVKRHHTHVMFAYFGSFMTTMARLMQGSATTFTESVILELTGTVCEYVEPHPVTPNLANLQREPPPPALATPTSSANPTPPASSLRSDATSPRQPQALTDSFRSAHPLLCARFARNQACHG
jgi:hypothetical protein